MRQLRILRIVASVAIAAAAFLVGTIGQAHAQYVTPQLLNSVSCSDPVYGTNGSFFQGNNTYPSRADYTSNCSAGNTSNAPGSVVTAVQTLRAATTQTASVIAARISKLRTASKTGSPMTVALNQDHGSIGLAGGDKRRGLGVWFQGAYVHFDNDQSALQFDGHVFTGLVGIDKRSPDDRLIVGVSAGYEGTGIDTTFNRGNLDADGFVIAPYLSYELNDGFSIDATLGYARVAYDMDRRDPITSEVFSGSTDANRYFGSLTGSYDHVSHKWRYGAHVGARYSYEGRDSFTETGTTGTTVAVGSQNTHLGQAIFGGTIGYDFGMFKPYVTGQGEYDFTKTDDPVVAANQTQPSDSDFGLRLGLGTDIDIAPNITGSFEVNSVLLRSSYSEYVGKARIRVEF